MNESMVRAVLEFPQSGERFGGVENFREWRRIYPASLAFEIRVDLHHAAMGTTGLAGALESRAIADVMPLMAPAGVEWVAAHPKRG
jgi:hypothetical protein